MDKYDQLLKLAESSPSDGEALAAFRKAMKYRNSPSRNDWEAKAKHVYKEWKRTEQLYDLAVGRIVDNQIRASRAEMHLAEAETNLHIWTMVAIGGWVAAAVLVSVLGAMT